MIFHLRNYNQLDSCIIFQFFIYNIFNIGALKSIPKEEVPNLQYGDGLGIMIVNIPFGDPKYVKESMSKKAGKLEKDQKNLTRLLSNGPADLQLAQALLTWCHMPRIDYWLQNVEPDLMVDAARRVDRG